MAPPAETLQVALRPGIAALVQRLDMVNFVPVITARSTAPIRRFQDGPAQALPVPTVQPVLPVKFAHAAMYMRGTLAVRFGSLAAAPAANVSAAATSSRAVLLDGSALTSL